MNHQARKRFGQNFLNDDTVIDRIISHIAPSASQHMVEIGPGLGALTLPLLEQLDTLHVVEIDRDLIARWRERQLSKLILHEGDALNMDWSSLAAGQPLRVVGNLPYNIGTPLLLELLNAIEHIQDVHVMLQKEVVDRLEASVGTRAYGRLSVMIQSGFTVQPLFDVPPSAFTPAPKIQSAVVRLTPKPAALTAEQLTQLSYATRLAFANKRKTLRNNLKEHVSIELLKGIDINPQARAETLSLEAFVRLSTLLQSPQQSAGKDT